LPNLSQSGAVGPSLQLPSITTNGNEHLTQLVPSHTSQNGLRQFGGITSGTPHPPAWAIFGGVHTVHPVSLHSSQAGSILAQSYLQIFPSSAYPSLQTEHDVASGHSAQLFASGQSSHFPFAGYDPFPQSSTQAVVLAFTLSVAQVSHVSVFEHVKQSKPSLHPVHSLVASSKNFPAGHPSTHSTESLTRGASHSEHSS